MVRGQVSWDGMGAEKDLIVWREDERNWRNEKGEEKERGGS